MYYEKIYFNDKCGLTASVLRGDKTVKIELAEKYDKNGCHLYKDTSSYNVGEIVAVGQNYKNAGLDPDTLQEYFVSKPTIFPKLDEFEEMSGWIDLPLEYHNGWLNKMNTLPGLMPHQIQFIDIDIMKLHDIREFVYFQAGIKQLGSLRIFGYHDNFSFSHPSIAFASLVDKVYGKGTWDSNPLVYIYKFELIK